MTELPLVSFIIPYYNAGATIQETIDSIFNQSYSNFDIWLINDGSTDQVSIDKLKDFEGIEKIHIHHQENMGPCIAKNYGVEKALGKLICFVDSDNILLENYIKEAVNILTIKINVDVIYSDFQFFGDKKGIHKSLQIDSFKIFIGNSVDNCVLIRKEAFLSVGGFDKYLSKLGLEDWELWINLLKNNREFYYLEKVHFKYRVISTSRTNTTANLNLDKISSYIAHKHSDFLAQIYKDTYYRYKMIKESIDFRIGKNVLFPFRFFKSIFFKSR
jgi:glycosyltransferase involved in cell wall biosynthesis